MHHLFLLAGLVRALTVLHYFLALYRPFPMRYPSHSHNVDTTLINTCTLSAYIIAVTLLARG